jgi:hypothetical protein
VEDEWAKARGENDEEEVGEKEWLICDIHVE